jgi:hypothetical protein
MCRMACRCASSVGVGTGWADWADCRMARRKEATECIAGATVFISWQAKLALAPQYAGKRAAEASPESLLRIASIVSILLLEWVPGA